MTTAAPKQNVEQVAGTADDAILSKLSCVRLKYYKDEFVESIFHTKTVRRSPIINRGYYARVQTVDLILLSFLQSTLSSKYAKKQIISLGAGMDTTFWKLHKYHNTIFNENLLKYFEIDFPETCQRKIRTLQKLPKLMLEIDAIVKPQINLNKGMMDSEKYSLISGDLCQWDKVLETMTNYGFNPNIPTLILSECVLIYMPVTASQTITKWSSTLSGGCAFVIYEQILPNDAFGKQMIRNLKERNLDLLSYETYGTKELQQKRLLDIGYQCAVAWDMNQLYRNYLPKDDVRRIERLEMFDEWEEWHIFMQHYIFLLGVKLPEQTTEDETKNWKNIGFLKNHLQSATLPNAD